MFEKYEYSLIKIGIWGSKIVLWVWQSYQVSVWNWKLGLCLELKVVPGKYFGELFVFDLLCKRVCENCCWWKRWREKWGDRRGYVVWKWWWWSMKRYSRVAFAPTQTYNCNLAYAHTFETLNSRETIPSHFFSSFVLFLCFSFLLHKINLLLIQTTTTELLISFCFRLPSLSLFVLWSTGPLHTHSLLILSYISFFINSLINATP